MSQTSFDRSSHIRYFAHCLRSLPDVYDKLDTNRLTLVHFCVQALDILGVLDEYVDKQAILEWMESLRVVSGGYMGGTFVSSRSDNYRHGHIAMTYTALCIQVALTGRLDSMMIHRSGIINLLTRLQRNDGSFQCIPEGSEHDMRFLYCACSISHMLQDWSGVDRKKAVKFIQDCKSFDGGIALLPGQEGHGGSTFCAVASLVLMGTLDDVLEQQDNWKHDLIQWCVSRQQGGMQGRPNKKEDTCYSYWIGGTLRLLGRDDLLDQTTLNRYVLSCQSPMGGFGKVFRAFPDVLHSFYSLAWLSLSEADGSSIEGRDNTQKIEGNEEQETKSYGLQPLNCTLGICQKRANVFGGHVP